MGAGQRLRGTRAFRNVQRLTAEGMVAQGQMKDVLAHMSAAGAFRAAPRATCASGPHWTSRR